MRTYTYSMLAIGVLSLAAWTSQSQAQVLAPNQSVPAGVDAPTVTLEMNGNEADTELVHYRRFSRGFYRGYARPVYGYGYRRSFSYGFYRPYRGFSYSYYRGFYPRYGYRYSYSYYPRYYFPRNYYYSGYGGFYGGGFYGGFYCSDDQSTPTVNLGELSPVPQVTVPYRQEQPQTFPAPNQPGNNGYQYDGGPQNPVPVPSTPAPKKAKPAPQPGAVLVSLPGNENSGHTYRAYGERVSNQPSSQTTNTSTGGFAYPAYGETKSPSQFATNR